MTNSILAKLNAPHVFGLALGRAGKKLNTWTASVCDKDGRWTPMCGGKTAEAAVAAAVDRIEPKDFWDEFENGRMGLKPLPPGAVPAADDELDFG